MFSPLVWAKSAHLCDNGLELSNPNFQYPLAFSDWQYPCELVVKLYRSLDSFDVMEADPKRRFRLIAHTWNRAFRSVVFFAPNPVDYSHFGRFRPDIKPERPHHRARCFQVFQFLEDAQIND